MLGFLVQLLIKRLAAVMKDAKPVGQHGGDRFDEFQQSDNINLVEPGGNRASYLAARLKKQRPDIAEANQETQSMPDNMRQIARYDFEGGSFVEVVFSSDIDIEEALETIEAMIRLKRAEIARRKERTLANQK